MAVGRRFLSVALWEIHVKGDKKRKMIKPGGRANTAPHVWVLVMLVALFCIGPILKYKDFTIAKQGMWNVKTRVISVTIEATGTISKSIRKYVSNIPGNHEGNAEKGQTTHCTHTLGVNAETSNIGNIKSNNRLAAIPYSLGTRFVS
jgi:hypothetical protein